MKIAISVLFLALLSTAAFAQSPVIVAQVKLLNQTGKIAPQVLFAPTSNGVYRISAYMTALPAQRLVGTVELGVDWFDDSERVRTFELASVGSSSGTWSGSSITVRAVVGKSIDYYVQQKGVTNFDYDLFITVEQLESD